MATASLSISMAQKMMMMAKSLHHEWSCEITWNGEAETNLNRRFIIYDCNCRRETTIRKKDIISNCCSTSMWCDSMSTLASRCTAPPGQSRSSIVLTLMRAFSAWHWSRICRLLRLLFSLFMYNFNWKLSWKLQLFTFQLSFFFFPYSVSLDQTKP